MIELRQDQLCVSMPQVHKRATCEISFIRTLRIPDDNREYPLPAGLGNFPMFHVDDYAKKVSPSWNEHGGVFLPMYQSEAMWISFNGRSRYPFAIKIAAGKINAVTGELWENKQLHDAQDYVVVPEQPWLDGFSVGDGLIRQFVAMPLGKGYTAEGQITGEEKHGGLQIAIYPMKRDVYEQRFAQSVHGDVLSCMDDQPMLVGVAEESLDMGLAPGGMMRQQIFDDPYGLDVWDTDAVTRCFVHIANSQSFHSITGSRPPLEPLTASDYQKMSIPWFDYWNDESKTVKGSEILASLDSVATKNAKQGKPVKEPVVDMTNQPIVDLSPKKTRVRDGRF